MNDRDKQNEAERWLDETLERYQPEPPRPGLEGRILANLAVAQAQERQGQRRWMFALAACVMALMAAAALIHVLRSRQETAVTAEFPLSPVQPSHPATTPGTGTIIFPSLTSVVHRHSRSTRMTARRARRALAQTADVKQEQFPGIAPLSEQGRRLQAYLQQTPLEELKAMAVKQRQAGTDIQDLTIEPLKIQQLAQIEDLDPDSKGKP